MESKPIIKEGTYTPAKESTKPAHQAPPKRQKSNVTKEEVIEFIKNLKAVEMGEFVKELEEIFGVTAQSTVPTTPVIQETKEPEQKEFDAILTSFGDKTTKIPVLKVVRELIFGMGLKDAKDFVESLPQPIKQGIPRKSAEEIKEKLEKVGGIVEIK